MACPEITIAGVSEEVYAKIVAEATDAGAKFEGTKASMQGLEFDWNYDAATETLHLTCTKKPIFASCGVVESRLREMVEKIKGAI